MVWCGWIPTKFVRLVHSDDVKGVPLSDEMCSGTPWAAIQVMRAFRQDCVVASSMGMASGHLVDLSIMVNRYLKPSDFGRGPTMSTWMCENLRVG